MTEKLSIKGKDVWVVVEPYIPEGRDPHVIPTEYFKVFYNLKDPGNEAGSERSTLINDRDDQPKLFESPVAALAYANKRLPELI